MTIAIVTPWLNHPELEADYFAAVEAAAPDQLVVVDDGSEPPLEFSAHRLPQQAGFCAATNAGLRLVETDAVLLLNNDIRMIRPAWLQEIAAKVKPGRFVGPLRFDRHGDVDGDQFPYIDGWCLAGMTADLRAVGGFDERYDEAGRSYYSDNALAFRARLHGITLCDHRPGLQHKGGQTGGFGEAFEEALAVNKKRFQTEVLETKAGGW